MSSSTFNEPHEIQIDCPPGAPRPDFWLPEVIKDTGLESADFQVTSKLFGHWIFQLTNTEKSGVFDDKSKKSVIVNRLRDLYNDGRIRYAEVS